MTGMFSFTGSQFPSPSEPIQELKADLTVTAEQVSDLAEHAHVYLTKDGRISMAGLNEHNLQVSCRFQVQFFRPS